jgi:hypothetical protein
MLDRPGEAWMGQMIDHPCIARHLICRKDAHQPLLARLNTPLPEPVTTVPNVPCGSAGEHVSCYFPRRRAGEPAISHAKVFLSTPDT